MKPSEEPGASHPPSRPWYKLLLVGAGLFWLTFSFLALYLLLAFRTYSIPSENMAPTLKIGDRVLVNHWAYLKAVPERGDIVIFRSPPEAGMEEADFLKRIIAFPGDTLDIREGKVYLNREALQEPYTKEPRTEAPSKGEGGIRPPYEVPPGYYFVMGDNRGDSNDSRYWGYLDGTRIKGKMIRKL